MVTVVGRYGEMACRPLPPVFGLRPAGPPTPLASLRGTHPGSRFAPADSSSLSLRSGGLILALAALRETHPRSRCAPGDSSSLSLRSGGLITGPSRFSLDTGRGFRDTCLVDNWGFREAVGIT